MRQLLFVAACLGVVGIVGTALPQNPAHVAPTNPRSPQDEKKGFKLPPGFEIQLVAAEPDIHKPMNLAFDARGRLWVTDTVEYPYPATGDGKPRDTVKILEDFGPDGRARKITTFADGLNIPIGVLPTREGALVHSIPAVYRLIDTDGDGKADRREVAYSGYGNRDTHGMTNAFTWGFDGWVYACHGFSNDSTIQSRGTTSLKLNSGNVYRMRADGSAVEPYSWGQVNPFGLAFDPLGHLFSSDCHTRPVMHLLRGAYYQSFGKPNDGLGFAPGMCDHDHGSTGIAGIIYYSADQFPADYQGRIFVGNVVTSRINQDRVAWTGASPKAIEQPDFLVSEDPWFRPVDLELGPDGAMYVADFYNRIIGHYEVPLNHPGRDRDRGRIWRIVYRGNREKVEVKPPRPDWTKATVQELTADLGHPNITVRTLATNELAGRGGPEVVRAATAALENGSNPWQQVHALWVLERCSALGNSLLVKSAKSDAEPLRVHAVRVMGNRKQLDAELRAAAVDATRDASPFVRQVAAETLGLHPADDQITPLLRLREKTDAADAHTQHAIRIALRNQLRTDAAWDKLAGLKLSGTQLRTIASVAPGVPSRAAARFLVDYLVGHRESALLLSGKVYHVARYGEETEEDRLRAILQHRKDLSAEQTGQMILQMQKGREARGGTLSGATRVWALQVAGNLLAAGQAGPARQGIELVSAMRLTELEAPLAKLAVDTKKSDADRINAIQAVAAIALDRHLDALAGILGNGNEPLAVREKTCETLARSGKSAALDRLVAALPVAPARLQHTIALSLAGSPAGAEKLLQAVTEGKASARLLRDRPVSIRLAESRLPDLQARVAKLTAGLPEEDEQLTRLLTERRSGYAGFKPSELEGLRVFEKHCAACHQLGQKGAKVGPQLDGVGIRGLERLLEDTLDPNRNVDQAFRSSLLELKNGQVVSGLLLREEGEVYVVADAQGKEIRVPRAQVETRTLSQLSPMPANFGEQIPESDFFHLIGFLLRQRPTNGGASSK